MRELFVGIKTYLPPICPLIYEACTISSTQRHPGETRFSGFPLRHYLTKRHGLPNHLIRLLHR